MRQPRRRQFPYAQRVAPTARTLWCCWPAAEFLLRHSLAPIAEQISAWLASDPQGLTQRVRVRIGSSFFSSVLATHARSVVTEIMGILWAGRIVREERYISAPKDAALVEDKVAAAAYGAPDGRQEADRAIAMPSHPPGRPAIRGQAQLNNGTTAAGAAHRRAPLHSSSPTS